MRGGPGDPWRRRLAVVAALVTLSACSTGGEQAPSPAPTQTPQTEPTTLATYDTDGVAVARAPFCDRLSPTGIEHALGDTAESHDDYGNGDRIRLPDGGRTIAHEYGCAWRAADGTTARAWVFAPPVTRRQARRLVDEAVAGRCTRTGGGDFGSPSVATRCRGGEGRPVRESSWRGLFGDAWLVCTVAGDAGPAVLDTRASEWCVAVLEAARA